MIRTTELTRRFGDRTAVERLSIEISEGEIVGLLGPNGAGKTTTIRMLAGMIEPTSGAMEVCGLDPVRQPERLHEAIGLLTETPGFYERLSAERNLAYFAGFYRDVDVRRSVREALDRAGLASRRSDRVSTFSKGMKQRLALARALLHSPRVLFLDEPTAGLDPEVAKGVRNRIRELAGERRTILVSTHNLSEAEELCGRIVILRTRLIADDTPSALRAERFERSFRLRLRSLPSGLLESIEAESYVLSASVEEDGGLLVVRLHDPDDDRPRLVARLVDLGGEVLEVSEARRSLEDVYLELVREEESE